MLVQVLSSSVQEPINLPSIALASNFDTIAYQNGTADDPIVKLAQPSGLLTDAINVPEVYAQQIGSSQQVRPSSSTNSNLMQASMGSPPGFISVPQCSSKSLCLWKASSTT